MKTAIIFDLDGTLLDTLDDLTDSVNAVLEAYGYPQRSIKEIRAFVGNGAEKLIRLAVPENCENFDDVYTKFREYYKMHSQIKTGPYKGIVQAIRDIAKEYPIAIVSNKPDEATKLLCGQYFTDVYARGESADCRRKPAPDMVFAAMKHLNVQKAIYVGDSEVDVLTAQNAKLPCISVLWGFRDEDELIRSGAQYFCKQPDDLVAVIQTVEGKYGK